MTNSALFEIGVEELPASEIDQIKQQLKDLSRDFLSEAKIDCEKLFCFVTNRRICILLQNVSDKQQDMMVLKKGPSQQVAFSDGKPTKALFGFLSANQASESDLFIQEGYVYLKKKIDGRRSAEVLPEIFRQIVLSLKFNKPMKWADGKYEFIRPVKWVLCIYNNEILPFELFGVRSSNMTCSHPYLAKKVQIERPEEYIDILRKHFVIVDDTERIERIRYQLDELEKEYGFKCDREEEMINKISKITEWPVAIVGNFKQEYLSLPSELITVTIKHHLSAFTTSKDGKTTTFFVAFVDRPEGDFTKVVHGYQNVVNARLEDAHYYLEIDKRYRLEDFNEKLKEMVFQKELGTLYDKVKRIEEISVYIVEKTGLRNLLEKTRRAAMLSKADIASHVVYEFPELQGVMGRIYALLSGEDGEVAYAIEEQYSERLQTKIGAIIGISDRVDTIVGNLAVGNIPSGSRDPFGLRTKMETILRAIILHKWDIDLHDLLNKALELLKMNCNSQTISDFVSSRYYSFLISEGLTYDVARAVNHLWRRPLRGFLSAKAISKMMDTDDFNKLCIGFERVHNITKNHTDTTFDGALFEKEAERTLLNQFVLTKSVVLESLRDLDYERAVISLISLKPYIDNYFNEVFVMSDREDIRRNRLGFLKSIDGLFMEIGDLTQLMKRE
ncbi:MAG TPA: glycine--tRNA ligase subunit beta [Pseudothermotoga sp.]|nr:glycine--tRNA ligase subunit beta [Pseudothermotoga sp.]HOK83107.1 glycine--tRNA ligase subunit beta [Pseudothermotoga sp.]HPP69722.1 glycine--tRNA ligase subunit beta [Pseudothermotoga sp.]